jgi:hypothetical protein
MMDVLRRRGIAPAGAALFTAACALTVGSCQGGSGANIAAVRPPTATGGDPSPAQLRNLGSFIYTRSPSTPADVRNTVCFLWSPTCRDSMRLFGNMLSKVMRAPALGPSDAIVITLFPRHDHDLRMAAELLVPDKSRYAGLVLTALAVGARQDRYLRDDDITKLVDPIRTSDTTGLYIREMAVQLAASVNEFVTTRLSRYSTPTLIVNERPLADPMRLAPSDILGMLRT